MWNKKGVSPLIATVLLVMIVVSIGAAVMVVIQGLTDEQLSTIDANKKLIECSSKMKVEIFSVGDDYRICYNYSDGGNSTFAIQLDNVGQVDIDDFAFTAVSDDIVDVRGLPALTKGAHGGLRLNFTTTGSSLSLIRLYPMLAGGSKVGIQTCKYTNFEWDADELAQFDNCDDVTWDDSSSITVVS
ncbi:MAG: hypothetical protein HGA85_05420 [Nanoarchaeota archaeon]|nr:hypothetical protein [Nanoarchaeota archaeon]